MGEKSRLINCNSTADQLAVANYHSTTESAFQGMLYNFWGAEADVVAPVSVPWVELEAQMLDKDCNTTCWKLEYNHMDTEANAIAFGFQELSPAGLPPSYEANITYFSFALIKGAQLKDGASEFQFYKAQYPDEEEEGKYAVVFQTLSDDRSVLGYYNLSTDYPIELPN